MKKELYYNCEISVYYTDIKGAGGSKYVYLVKHKDSGNELYAISMYQAEAIARLLDLDYVLSSKFYAPDDTCIDGG